VLSRLNVGSGLNLQAGYVLPSDWAFAARYSTLQNDISAASFADYNRFYTFVTTKYLSQHNLKMQFEIGYDALKSSLKTATQSGSYYTNLQVTVQL